MTAHTCPDCTDGRAPGIIERLEAIQARCQEDGWFFTADDIAAVIADLRQMAGEPDHLIPTGDGYTAEVEGP